jgi:type I restriction enzyme S subunit
VVKPGDLILSNSATPGIPKFMGIEACIHDGWMLLRNFRGALPQFLYYRLLFDRPALVGLGNGSVFTNLKTDILKSHVVALPPLEEQRRIAGVLGALDDLIEVNRGLIRDLDELFHTTWFRDFAQRVASEETPLAELCSTQYGFTDSATDDPAGPKFLRVADINKRNWINWNDVPHCSIHAREGDKYKLRKGDLVVARMADPGKCARVESEVDAVFASYLVRLKLHDPELGLFLYGFLKSRFFSDYSRSSTTGSVQKNMNATVIVNVKFGVPDTEAVAKFNQVAEPLREAIVALQEEIADLEATRDELLPLMMSGRVRVGDVAS